MLIYTMYNLFNIGYKIQGIFFRYIFSYSISMTSVRLMSDTVSSYE